MIDRTRTPFFLCVQFHVNSTFLQYSYDRMTAHVDSISKIINMVAHRALSKRKNCTLMFRRPIKGHVLIEHVIHRSTRFSPTHVFFQMKITAPRLEGEDVSVRSFRGFRGIYGHQRILCLILTASKRDIFLVDVIGGRERFTVSCILA